MFAIFQVSSVIPSSLFCLQNPAVGSRRKPECWCRCTLGVLHMLHLSRRAQLPLPQPGHVQSPSLNSPAGHHAGGVI